MLLSNKIFINKITSVCTKSVSQLLNEVCRGLSMSRELQDKADIVMKELKELLVPISSEIQMRRFRENGVFRAVYNTGKVE